MKFACFSLSAALILATSMAQAAPKYNPRDPNTNDRKAASCHYSSQVNREESQLIRPRANGTVEVPDTRDSGKIAR